MSECVLKKIREGSFLLPSFDRCLFPTIDIDTAAFKDTGPHLSFPFTTPSLSQFSVSHWVEERGKEKAGKCQIAFASVGTTHQPSPAPHFASSVYTVAVPFGVCLQVAASRFPFFSHVRQARKEPKNHHHWPKLLPANSNSLQQFRLYGSGSCSCAANESTTAYRYVLSFFAFFIMPSSNILLLILFQAVCCCLLSLNYVLFVLLYLPAMISIKAAVRLAKNFFLHNISLTYIFNYLFFKSIH